MDRDDAYQVNARLKQPQPIEVFVKQGVSGADASLPQETAGGNLSKNPIDELTQESKISYEYV
jgi:hypothetical protein